MDAGEIVAELETLVGLVHGHQQDRLQWSDVRWMPAPYRLWTDEADDQRRYKNFMRVLLLDLRKPITDPASPCTPVPLLIAGQVMAPLPYEPCDWEGPEGRRCYLYAGHPPMKSPSGAHSPDRPMRAVKPERAPDPSGYLPPDQSRA